MLLSYTHLTDGPGPSEAVVEINTLQGTEEVIVDRGILLNGYFDVGVAIGRRPGQTLVELPRESVSGRTRVWVPEKEIREADAA